MSQELETRLGKLEDEVWRQHPENPGLSMRLYRAEQLLNVMLKFGGSISVLVILWRFADILWSAITKGAVVAPPG